MNSRVGFTTGAITVAMVLAMSIVWAMGDSVWADEDGKNAEASQAPSEDSKSREHKKGSQERRAQRRKLQEEQVREQKAYADLEPGDSIRASYMERKVLAELEDFSVAEYRHIPLMDALANLANRHDINIVFENSAVADAGLTFDEQIEDLRIHLSDGKTFGEVLDRILDPKGLAYLVEDDALKVTAGEILAKRVITRAYAIPATQSIAARKELASHLTSLLFAKRSSSSIARANERLEDGEAEDEPNMGFSMSPTIEVFTDRVVIVGSLTDHKVLQELLRLIYQDYILTEL